MAKREKFLDVPAAIRYLEKNKCKISDSKNINVKHGAGLTLFSAIDYLCNYNGYTWNRS